MSNWFTRLFTAEDRALTESNTPDLVPFSEGGPLHLETVSQSQALSLAPVYAANRLLASSISTLPLRAYRRVPDARIPMTAMPQLFEQLSYDGKLVPWLHRCVTSMGLRGNAYGLVTQRDGYGYPTAITWLDPSAVTTDDAPGRTGWWWNGKPVAREDMVHIPWFTTAGQTLGLSPIGAFAATMGVGLKAQEYASDWFAAGGFPPGTFKNSEKRVSQDEAAIVKSRLTQAIRTRQPMVYGNDWDYTPVSVPPNEAQFIETMRMTTSQVASIYGIPPEMIGGETGSSMTYANVEQQQINFVMFTLRPWLVALETAFSALLPDRQYVKFNSDALIRADLRTRHEVYRIDRSIGLRSINEMRALEELPPLPGGQGEDYTPLGRTQAPPEDDTAEPGAVLNLNRRWVSPR